METQLSVLGKEEYMKILTQVFNDSYNIFFVSAKKYVKSVEDAEDVLMDVFTKLLAKDFETDNWLYFILAMIKNQSLDFLKKKKPEYVEDMYQFKGSAITRTDCYEDKQRLEVYLVKAELTSDQKKLWKLIEKGYENADIAVRLGKSADQIRRERFTLIRKIYRTALKIDRNL